MSSHLLTLGPMVYALGVAQVISWGTLFYAIGVLGPRMGRDLGVSELAMFGAFTVGLVVSGVASPYVGKLVDERGGRFVLSRGSLLAVIALLSLAAAVGPVTVFIAWMLAGLAMSAALYDPAFATLSQTQGLDYRKAVTALTLMGAFASTVFWPVSHVFADAWGWRFTWVMFAALHLCICLPLHLSFVPRRLKLALPTTANQTMSREAVVGRSALKWLTPAFALASFVFAVVVVHVINLLKAAGLSEAQAITIAMLIGPMQVVGRLAEFGFRRRLHAVAVGFAPYALMIVALASLLGTSGPGVLPLLFVLALGCGNGILTIARGTVPHELFGSHKLGELLGGLSRASLFSRALAPASLSAMSAIGISRLGGLAALFALACCGAVCYAMAVRGRPLWIEERTK